MYKKTKGYSKGGAAKGTKGYAKGGAAKGTKGYSLGGKVDLNSDLQVAGGSNRRRAKQGAEVNR